MNTAYLAAPCRRVLVGLSAIPLLAGILSAQTTPNNTNPGPPGGTAGWTKVFEDDFTGTSIDTTKWATDWMGQRWWRLPANGGITYYRPENLVVSDGTLKIVTKRESVSGSQFTSGIITTYQKKDFGPGHYFEARVKAPLGKGLWSSFWTRSSATNDWPPEIDMFELWDETWRCVAYQSWHYNDAANNYAKGQTQFKVWGDDPALPWKFYTWGNGWYADYHIFAADWQNDRIDFYIDGVKTGTATSNVSQYSNRKQFLILQIIGDGGWAPALDSTTPLPANYTIDWVRAWQKGSVTPPASYGFYSETVSGFAADGGTTSSYGFNVTQPTTTAPEGTKYLRVVSVNNYASYTWNYPAAGKDKSAWSGKSLKFKARSNAGGFSIILSDTLGANTSITLDGKVPTNNTWVDVSIPLSSFTAPSLAKLRKLELYRLWATTNATLEVDHVRVE
jgi:beta-glucanase (GH16 family)